MDSNVLGSPPLAREQLILGIVTVITTRITPARAGTTSPEIIAGIQPGDHPRSRGNNNRKTESRRGGAGSPPLAREQLIHLPANTDYHRITPARAGTTFFCAFHGPFIRDHPRSRGNNASEKDLEVKGRGSPPLAREQHAERVHQFSDGRITPARAGTTGYEITVSASPEDHPRSRGNNNCHLSFLTCHPGSPPLAREQLRLRRT